MEELIKCHQEFINLNSKFVAIDAKNQYTVPMRNYVIIVHNNIGNNLNILMDKIKDIYKTEIKYEVLSSKE